MGTGKFYFLSDDYYIKFNDEKMMSNKEMIDGKEHNRPCYYAFKDDDDSRILWMIPVSSQVSKYANEYNKSIEKYGKCDTISFGYLKGNKNAFLLQNMCPIIEKYILNEYCDAQTARPIEIPNDLKRELNAKARKIIRLANKGTKLSFTNIIKMKQELVREFDN